MPTLLDSLASSSKRNLVITDCVTLIDEEVSSKSGLGGLAVKTAYKLVKGFKPGFIQDVVNALLKDFCTRLQPIVDASQGQPVPTYFQNNRGSVADALLAITDDRAQRTRHTALKGAYEKLRPYAKKHVEEAVPRLAAMLQKHLGD